MYKEGNKMLIYWFVNTNVKDVDIAQQIVAVYAQP